MASTTTRDVARAEPAHTDTISETLAQAFHDDPLFTWLVPDAVDRRRRLPPMFAVFSDFFLPHGETYLARDGAGAAMWTPAGVEPVPAEQGELFARRMSAVLGDDAERGFAVNEVLEEHHPAEPCFYLQFVGVAPEHQGRGIGSRLLRTVLQRCDATGTPAYLEASSRDNRRLYERHGFVVTAEVTAPDGPPLWPMWRDPAPSR